MEMTCSWKKNLWITVHEEVNNFSSFGCNTENQLQVNFYVRNILGGKSFPLALKTLESLFSFLKNHVVPFTVV